MSITVQQDATIHSFILSVNCSTCFGWFLHPSSGAQITVPTASGTGQPLLLPVAVMEELRLVCLYCTVSTPPRQPQAVTDAVDTVICAPDDGWRNKPKHVEQFTDKIKLCIVAFCWTFIDI